MNNLTVREAAARLRLSEGSVYALVAAGRLRHHRVGLRRGRILVPEDAVGEYLAGGRPAEARQPAPRRPAGGYRRLGV